MPTVTIVLNFPIVTLFIDLSETACTELNSPPLTVDTGYSAASGEEERVGSDWLVAWQRHPPVINQVNATAQSSLPSKTSHPAAPSDVAQGQFPQKYFLDITCALKNRQDVLPL